MIVIADQQRTDAGTAFGRVGESANDEFLLLEALCFDPRTVAGGGVGRRGELGDDAFCSQAAGLIEELLSVALKCSLKRMGESSSRGEKLFEEFFAPQEREAAKVVSVEMKQIEGEVVQVDLCAFLECRLQSAKLVAPFSSSTTVSPSTMALSQGNCSAALARSGMRCVQSRPLRVRSETRFFWEPSPGRTWIWMR